MKTSDELYHLIRSLSKSEKRYFKLFASLQRGEKKYLRLFDAIDAQQEYDEAAIKEKFRGEKFTKQLNVAKRYLHELILKSLRVYHSEYGGGTQAKDHIKSVEILYTKRLLGQAAKMVDRAIRVADEHHATLPLFEALYWNATVRPEIFSTEEGVDRDFDRLYDTLDRLRNELDYERILLKASVAMQKGRPRTEAEYELIRRCQNDPLLQHEELALSLRARVMRLYGLAICHFAIGEHEQGLRATDEQIALIEANPSYIAEHTHHYIYALSNRLMLLRVILNDTEFLQQMEAIRAKTRALIAENSLKGVRVRYFLFATTYLNLLPHCISAGAFEEGLRMVAEIEEAMERFGDHVSEEDRMQLQHNLALLFFGLGDYRRALDYVNAMMLAPEPGRGQQSYYHARLFQLIVHFELGNIELLPYLVKSVYRYYRAQDSLHRFESSVLSFFRKLPGVYSQPQLINVFRELQSELRVLEHEPSDRWMLNYFPYIEWLESKITGHSFAELIREAARRRDARDD